MKTKDLYERFVKWVEDSAKLPDPKLVKDKTVSSDLGSVPEEFKK